MLPVPSFSTRRWERKSSSRARSWTFMTLVERHFDFGSFLCREEIVIEDGFGAGGRRGEERREKERNKKKRSKKLWRGDETRRERA